MQRKTTQFLAPSSKVNSISIISLWQLTIKNKKSEKIVFQRQLSWISNASLHFKQNPILGSVLPPPPILLKIENFEAQDIRKARKGQLTIPKRMNKPPMQYKDCLTTSSMVIENFQRQERLTTLGEIPFHRHPVPSSKDLFQCKTVNSTCNSSLSFRIHKISLNSLRYFLSGTPPFPTLIFYSLNLVSLIHQILPQRI